MKLHLVRNEKIINRCINNFEQVFPGNNKFIVINPSSHSYVDNRACTYFLTYGTEAFWEEVGDVNQYDAVIIHYLKEETADFILRINHPNIYWIEWGADLYSSLLEPKGYLIYSDKKLPWRIHHHKIPFFIYDLVNKYKSKKTRDLLLSAVKKVKYFVPDSMYDEYPLLLNYYPELSHLIYKEFFYYPIDEVLDSSLLNADICGNNIIVGNSSSMSSNHIDVFKRIRTLDLKDIKVIVPLSYGDKNYSQYVIREGYSLLGNAFSPLLDYLELSEYNKILLSANCFVYGNWRQEAVGNILVALYLGGKVFLYKKNPLLNFYRSLGLHLFEIDELSQHHIDSRLSKDEISNNRRILLNHYSRERQIGLIRKNF